MAQEAQKPRITEIQVRMDCNGCVQKIKKALHGVNGIYDLYIDLPQQKITLVGWADPENIVKAIKKTRKSAIICSHIEPEQPAEPARDGGAPPPPPPPPDAANPPPGDQSSPPPTETTPPAEPPKDPPPEAKPLPEAVTPPPSTTETAKPNMQPREPTRPKDVEEVHVIYHYPPDYGYGYNNYPNGPTTFRREPPPYAGGPAFRPEPQPPHYVNNTSHGYGSSTYANGPSFVRPEPPSPQYATLSYNTHRPSPYVTQYEYVRPPPPTPPGPPPPPPQYTHYSRPVPYSEDFHYQMGNNYNNGNIGSVFSDENPNSCSIV